MDLIHLRYHWKHNPGAYFIGKYFMVFPQVCPNLETKRSLDSYIFFRNRYVKQPSLEYWQIHHMHGTESIWRFSKIEHSNDDFH